MQSEYHLIHAGPVSREAQMENFQGLPRFEAKYLTI